MNEQSKIVNHDAHFFGNGGAPATTPEPIAQFKATGPIKKTGKTDGKSNRLGHGGRAAQLKARGVPGGVIGALARKAHAAPGQKNYHGGKK